MIRISMNFPYINPPGFPPGDWRRPLLISRNTWDAIICGERTATTRFRHYYKCGSFAQLKALLPGQIVHFYRSGPETGTQTMKVEVLPSDLSLSQMEWAKSHPDCDWIQGLGGALYFISTNKFLADTPEAYSKRMEWSRLEGWDQSFIPWLFKPEWVKTVPAFQFQYRFIEVI
jgi:hypothetical protein